MLALAAIASLAFVAPVGARAAAATPARAAAANPAPGSAAPAAAATIKSFSLAGYVPSGTVAISGNVTVTGQSTAGFVAGRPEPDVADHDLRDQLPEGG